MRLSPTLTTKTPADVENSKAKAVSTPKKATAGKASSKINETSAASYDLDEFEQRSIHADLIYKKKGDKK